MHLEPGTEYIFKYITNENNWVINEEEPKKKDASGNINNFFKIGWTSLILLSLHSYL